MEVRSHPWNEDSFCLVIGEKFIYSICAWLAGMLQDIRSKMLSIRRTRQCDYPHPPMAESTKIARIKEFINHNNWITPYGSQPHVTIRSSSRRDEQLQAFRQQMSGSGSWCTYDVKAISSIEDCCPEPPEDGESAWMVSRPSDNPQVQIPLRHRSESAPVPKPFQLTHTRALSASDMFERELDS